MPALSLFLELASIKHIVVAPRSIHNPTRTASPTDDVATVDANANNTTPPHHPPPLSHHSLPHRLHRLPAPNLPFTTSPLRPTSPAPPARPRHTTSPLRQIIQHHSPATRAALRIPLQVPLGASRAIGVCEFVSCVPAIPCRYLAYFLSLPLYSGAYSLLDV